MKKLKKTWKEWYMPDSTDWEAEEWFYKFTMILCLGLMAFAAIRYFC